MEFNTLKTSHAEWGYNRHTKRFERCLSLYKRYGAQMTQSYMYNS